MTSLSAFSFSSQLFQSQSPVESLIPISSLCEDYSGGALIANNVQRTHSTMYLSSRVQVLSSGVLPPPSRAQAFFNQDDTWEQGFFYGQLLRFAGRSRIHPYCESRQGLWAGFRQPSEPWDANNSTQEIRPLG